jgi:CBS domain containing-hemolysin-like protein
MPYGIGNSVSARIVERRNTKTRSQGVTDAARDAMVARAQGRPADARSLARPVPELTEDAMVAAAIDLLRRRRSILAVVRDESGRPTGMVTPDDLLARFLQPQAA